MTYAGTNVISYVWLSKSSVWHNDNISISLQRRHMDVTACEITGNSTDFHHVNSRDQLADPHGTRFFFQLEFMLDWSLNDRSMFALIISREQQRDDWRNLECKKFSTSSIFVVQTHSSFTPTWMSVDFMCPSIYILVINKTFWCWC